MIVPDEVYKAYKNEINHEAYLHRLDIKHKVFCFEDFDASVVDIAKEKDTNPMKISRLRNKILEKLRKILDK